jgi:hypothetical protein
MPSIQHLDRDAALEQVVQDDERFEQVAAEPVDFLHGQQLALHLLLEDLHTDRIERVMLARGLLSLGADADEPDQCHRTPFLFV